jgi:putative Mg2+ transporter-C (MgtC) family protein
MDNLAILPHLVALSVAYVLAFPIAWDREKGSRSAGLRTFPLVALAACGFVQATEGFAGADPGAMARIIEGLITGVGFIGGGAIIRHGNSVRGTATAASLWATGAIGAAAGLENYGIAILISAFTFATLRLFRLFKVDEGADDPEDREKAA